MKRAEYKADIVAAGKPPKVVERKLGSAFPGMVSVVFRYPGAAVTDGGITGFGVTTTHSDSGDFGGKG